jgi:hypothetical protein
VGASRCAGSGGKQPRVATASYGPHCTAPRKPPLTCSSANRDTVVNTFSGVRVPPVFTRTWGNSGEARVVSGRAASVGHEAGTACDQLLWTRQYGSTHHKRRCRHQGGRCEGHTLVDGLDGADETHNPDLLGPLLSDRSHVAAEGGGAAWEYIRQPGYGMREAC